MQPKASRLPGEAQPKASRGDTADTKEKLPADLASRAAPALATAQYAVTRLLDGLARAFALAGGAILVALTLMSAASIAGRTVLGTPVPGDFELVQVACGVSIAAFLPYCQLRRGHIIVDFFTARASRRAQGTLDALGALAVAAVMALLAWRTVVGMLTVKTSGEVSMIVGFPTWIGYAAIVPSLALAALVGVATAVETWKAARG